MNQEDISSGIAVWIVRSLEELQQLVLGEDNWDDVKRVT